MGDTAASLTQWAVGVVLGAVGGSLGTLVALRTRLAKTDRDIVDGTNALKRHIVDEQVALDRLDKRLMILLKITVDIARKVQVDNREIPDALVRMLTDDT